MSKACLRLVLLLLLLSQAGYAWAEGFALYDYSARGVALGGAVMARKADPSAVAYNPALLARLPGTHIQGGFTAIAPFGTMKTTDASGHQDTTKIKRDTWFVPNLYFTHQINDDFTFGIGEFTRYGLGFEYPDNWPGRGNIYKVNLQSFSVNPNLAWRATDKLSLAAGVELVYVTLDIKKRVKGTHTFLGSYEVDSNIEGADDFGIGFNIAGHYQFNDQWAVGLQYRSQVKVHAYGDVDFNLISGDPLIGSGFKDGGADASVILPDSIAGGISWTPIPELSFEAGAVWTRWSQFRSLTIDTPAGTTRSQKDWKNTWRFNFGVEYDALDWLTLRAGYVYDRSPMTDKYQDYLVPTNDRSIYSAGLGFHWDSWNLDLAYGYIHANSRNFRAGYGDVLDSNTKNTRTHMVSVSLGYEF